MNSQAEIAFVDLPDGGMEVQLAVETAALFSERAALHGMAWPRKLI